MNTSTFLFLLIRGKNMNSNNQEQVSRFVHDKATFRWKIENFSFEKVFETEGAYLESPSYRHEPSKIDWKFTLCRKLDRMHVHLVPHQTTDLPQLAMCKIRFHSIPGALGYTKKFPKPIQVLQLKTSISINGLKNTCVKDDVFTISCELMVGTLADVLSRSRITASQKEEALQRRLLTLSESLGSILNESKLSDVTLKVGADNFQAHKAILASRSSVFNGMFLSGMKESQESVVEIVDMKSSTAKELLRFIYTGNIEELSMDRAMDLYSAADRYDLQELKSWCKDFIVNYTSADYVCNVAVLADMHQDEELTRAAKRVCKEEYKTLLKSQTWRDFALNSPSVCVNLVESTLLNES